MKISTNWLSDYVKTDLSPEKLGDLLTMSGLELEEIERFGVDVEGVVVGYVLEVLKHPNADRLTLCKVDLGEDEPVQIVCGAPNVAAGQKVPVATVSTTLMLPSRENPDERVPVKIKKSKLRGEVSEGMICAEDELGLGDDHDGILVLDDSARVGQSFSAYLAGTGRANNDAVLDLAITPNRPDATSHIGVARDVATLTGEPLLFPETDSTEPGGEAAEQLFVDIEDPEGCPRYVGMVIRDVAVGPSPDWLKSRLEVIGLRPINNVVDVTNFVLHELGQPLHAFDYDLVTGQKIVVRRSTKGESITTLDGEERKLPEDTLLICDAEKPVAIAGVMGGANSEVSDTTTSLILESAYFEPVSVRKAAKALGMQTDASYRFERGVDPTMQARAATRAAQLIVEVAGGTIIPGLVDANPIPYEPRTVHVRSDRISKVLGAEIPGEEVEKLLVAIGFEVTDAESNVLDTFAEAAMREEGPNAAASEATSAGLHLMIPPFRPDIEREIDVIEEVARLWGFDRIPSPATTPVPLVPAGNTPEARLLDKIRTRFVGLGYRELYTNSLVSKEIGEQFASKELADAARPPVETLNPISQDMAAMRPSLLPGLLNAVAYNQARGAENVRFIELGHIYSTSSESSELVSGYHEHTSLILGISGIAEQKSWDSEQRELDIYDLKGALMHVLQTLDLPEIEEHPVPEAGDLTSYRLELSVGGQRLAVLARTSDALAEQFDLRTPVFFAELNADLLASFKMDRRTRYIPISRFPAVDRDLAVVIADEYPVAPLLQTIKSAAGSLLDDVHVFDLYKGEGVGDGQKSVAFALRFVADRTLRDKEVDASIEKVVKALKANHQATLRG